MSQYNISGLRVRMQDIVNQHLSQDYGNLNSAVLIDQLRTKYHMLPNEALYLIDCKNAQLEPLSKNFSRVIGIDSTHQNELITLYQHVGEVNCNALIYWVTTMLNGLFESWTDVQAEIDIFRCLYKTRDERVILKSTTPLVYDSNGTMRYSLGKLTDLTEIIDFQHFTYKFDGPSKDTVQKTYSNKMEEINILTQRETEIIKLIAAGMSSEEIAGQLFISKLTVDKHRRNIIEKLNTTSTTEAYRKCKNQGFF